MVVELTIGLLALYLSPWFAVPFLALVFVIPFVLKGIICPKCGTPVTYQGTFFGAIEIGDDRDATYHEQRRRFGFRKAAGDNRQHRVATSQ